MNRLASTGETTPPTQWRTWCGVLVGITVCDLRGGGGCSAAGGDGVADDDAFGADEDVLDEQAQHALLLVDGCSGCVVLERGEEAFEAGGELEVAKYPASQRALTCSTPAGSAAIARSKISTLLLRGSAAPAINSAASGTPAQNAMWARRLR